MGEGGGRRKKKLRGEIKGEVIGRMKKGGWERLMWKTRMGKVKEEETGRGKE